MLALLLVPTALFAQASLTGTVRDTSGAVLPGVTVEASSPALIEKVRSVVTDADGIYRIVDLRPGTYTLSATLPGFSTVRREGIPLAGSQTLTIPLEMRVGGLEETITVTGETPVVDVQNTKRESVIDADIIAALPATRAYGSLLNATPGIVVDNNGLAATPTMTFFSARGGQANEGRVTINGMVVAAAFNGGGVSSLTYDTNNVDEVSVLVAGGLGEQDIGGPVMNLVPRAGGNNFRGQAFYNTAGDWSRGDNIDDELRSIGYTAPPGIIGSYDGSVSYGGPVKRDRLWFYGSYRKLDTTSNVGRVVANRNAFNPNAWLWEADPSVTARSLQGREMFIGRVTGQVQKHRLSFNHEFQTRCEGAPLQVSSEGCHNREEGWIGLGTATQSPEAATAAGGGYMNFPYYVTQAIWTAPMTNKILLEGGWTRFSYLHAGGPGQVPPDGMELFNNFISVTEQSTAINPATGQRYAPNANYIYRSIPTWNDNYGNPNNWRASVSYVTGAHNMKVGYQGAHLIAKSTFVNPDRPGAVSYRFNNGVPNAFTFRLPTWQQSDITNSTSFFVQDTWTRGRLTMQGALRYDRASSYSPETHNGTDITSIFNSAPIRFPRTEGVSAYNDITPRVGVAYDVFGTGRTAIKFSAGHYLDAATNDSIYTTNNPANRIVRQVMNRQWTDTNGNRIIDCDLANFAAQSAVDTCGGLTGNDLNFGSTGAGLATVNEALLGGWGVRENDWQWGVNVQHQLIPRVSVEVGYSRRWWRGQTVSDDLERDPSEYDRYVLTAPVDPRLPNGGGYPIELWAPTQAAANTPARNQTRLESDFGMRREYWHGVDFTANARLGGLTMQFGTNTGRKVNDRCGVYDRINTPGYTPGETGSITNCLDIEPVLTTLRGLASYTVPKVDVLLSGTIRKQPGLELMAINWNVPNSVIAAALGRPLPGAVATGNTTINLRDTNENRYYVDQNRMQIDMRIAKIVRLGTTRSDIGIDIGNVLNTNYGTAFDTTYQYGVPNGGTFLNRTEVLSPRFLRFNYTLNF